MGLWVHEYAILLNKKGINPKYAEWYVKRVETFMRYAGCTNPAALARELVEHYLAELGRQKALESWQIRQIVDAIRILVLDLAGHEWAAEVDWHFWRGTRKEVDGDHATLYRESRKVEADFSGYNLNEHGAPPEGLEVALERIRQAVRKGGLSVRTEQTYLLWSEKFLRFCSSGSPEGLGAKEIEAYLSFLALKKNAAASTQRQAKNSIYFMFKRAFEADPGEFSGFMKSTRPRRLPVVLTVDEARALLAGMKGARQLMAAVMYGSGLRLMECLRLRVQDLDFGYGVIMVRSGKGGKDRRAPLPASYADRLRHQVELVAKLHGRDLKAGFGEVYLPPPVANKMPKAGWELKWQYLFPSSKLSVDKRSGKTRRHHAHESAVQKAIKKVAACGAYGFREAVVSIVPSVERGIGGRQESGPSKSPKGGTASALFKRFESSGLCAVRFGDRHRSAWR